MDHVLLPVNVVMYRVLISSDAAQTQDEMFPGGGSAPAPPLGPLPSPISAGNSECWSGSCLHSPAML